MSQINTNAILDASGGTTTSINGFTPTVSNMAGRNRLINSDMRIDQRNAGASVTPTAGVYSVDRWAVFLSQASRYSFQRNAGSVTPPAGFTNYLGITSTSAYSVLSSDFFFVSQSIEGFNVADLGWGAAGAQTVTLSFKVRSSLTGTFGGAIRNGGATRNYPFTYTISAANTWTDISITIPGDTSGTWATDNSAGLIVSFGLGAGSTFSGTAGAWANGNIVTASGAVSVVGTNGATFYITGVQLEEGSVATPFCPAGGGSYGAELALCQRYYYRTADDGTLTNLMTIPVETSTSGGGGFPHPVSMRTVPTITLGSGIRFYSAASGIRTPTIATNRSSTTTFAAIFAFTGATAGQAGVIYKGDASGFVEANAEL